MKGYRKRYALPVRMQRKKIKSSCKVLIISSFFVPWHHKVRKNHWSLGGLVFSLSPSGALIEHEWFTLTKA